MRKITVEDKTEFPTYHVKVTVKNTCTICHSPFTWDDFWRTIGRSNHAEVRNGICSTCQHWVDNMLADFARDYAIIEGKHYVIGAKLENYIPKATDSLDSIAENFSSPGKRQNKGMGGSKIIIRFKNAAVVITDDLWHQGTIPQHFRKYPAFQDNAEFVS